MRVYCRVCNAPAMMACISDVPGAHRRLVFIPETRDDVDKMSSAQWDDFMIYLTSHPALNVSKIGPN